MCENTGAAWCGLPGLFPAVADAAEAIAAQAQRIRPLHKRIKRGRLVMALAEDAASQVRRCVLSADGQCRRGLVARCSAAHNRNNKHICNLYSTLTLTDWRQYRGTKVATE